MADLVVAGSGFGRTGTLSLTEAYKKLRLSPAHHMTYVVEHDDFSKWERVFTDMLAGREPDLDAVLSGVKAQSDFPGALVVPLLVKRYPALKVVHTIRDNAEKWIASARQTIFQATMASFRGYHELRGLGWPDRLILFVVRGFARMAPPMFDVWLGTDVSGTLEREGYLAACASLERAMADDELLRKAYEGWTERIGREVEPDNLLVFNVKEGWNPLCDFLGLPVPVESFPLIRETVELKREPFPNVNDAGEFRARIRGIRGYVVVAKGIAYGVRAGAVAAAGYAAWRIVRALSK